MFIPTMFSNIVTLLRLNSNPMRIPLRRFWVYLYYFIITLILIQRYLTGSMCKIYVGFYLFYLTIILTSRSIWVQIYQLGVLTNTFILMYGMDLLWHEHIDLTLGRGSRFLPCYSLMGFLIHLHVTLTTAMHQYLLIILIVLLLDRFTA